MAETISLDDGRGRRDFPVRDGAAAGIYIGGRRSSRGMRREDGMIAESLAAFKRRVQEEIDGCKARIAHSNTAQLPQTTDTHRLPQTTDTHRTAACCLPPQAKPTDRDSMHISPSAERPQRTKPGTAVKGKASGSPAKPARSRRRVVSPQRQEVDAPPGDAPTVAPAVAPDVYYADMFPVLQSGQLHFNRPRTSIWTSWTRRSEPHTRYRRCSGRT